MYTTGGSFYAKVAERHTKRHISVLTESCVNNNKNNYTNKINNNGYDYNRQVQP